MESLLRKQEMKSRKISQTLGIRAKFLLIENIFHFLELWIFHSPTIFMAWKRYYSFRNVMECTNTAVNHSAVK